MSEDIPAIKLQVSGEIFDASCVTEESYYSNKVFQLSIHNKVSNEVLNNYKREMRGKSYLSTEHFRSRVKKHEKDRWYYKRNDSSDIFKTRNHLSSLVRTDDSFEEISNDYINTKYTKSNSRRKQDTFNVIQTTENTLPVKLEVTPDLPYNLIELEDDMENLEKIQATSSPEIYNLCTFAHKRVQDCSFKCDPCEKYYSTKGNMRKHDLDVLNCSKCAKTYKTHDKFEKHLRKHKSSIILECDYCKRTFLKKNKLRTHMKVHTNDTLYKCGVCSYRFLQFARCKVHKKNHLNRKSYQCDICGALFLFKKDLKIHSMIHTEKFPCQLCPFSFSRAGELRKHMAIHRNDRRYNCHLCDKKFARSHKLREHLRTHTGEKPFECMICKKRYALSNNLKIHMRSHTGEKPFSCDVCQKRFTQLIHMRLHMLTHTTLENLFMELQNSS